MPHTPCHPAPSAAPQVLPHTLPAQLEYAARVHRARVCVPRVGVCVSAGGRVCVPRVGVCVPRVGVWVPRVGVWRCARVGGS